MPSDTAQAKDKAMTPPYAAFASVKSTIGMLKEHGIPNRVDPTLLKSFSGSVSKQVLLSLRFMRLIDDNGNPQLLLRQLCDAFGTEKWPEQLATVVQHAYAPMFEINVVKATSGELTERFRTQFACEGETLRKALTFFLHACKEATIQLSPYILKGIKLRANGTNGRKRPAKVAKGNAAPPLRSAVEDGDEEVTGDHDSTKKRHKLPGLIAALVASLPSDGEDWSLDEATIWLQTAAYNFRYAYRLDGILKVVITPTSKGAEGV